MESDKLREMSAACAKYSGGAIGGPGASAGGVGRPVAPTGPATPRSTVVKGILFLANGLEVECCPAEFGAKPKFFDTPMVLVDPPMADAAIKNADKVVASIAVVHRGGNLIQEKAKLAQDAGAVGMIIINHSDELFTPLGFTHGNAGHESVKIPVVAVSQAGGSSLSDGERVSFRLQEVPGGIVSSLISATNDTSASTSLAPSVAEMSISRPYEAAARFGIGSSAGSGSSGGGPGPGGGSGGASGGSSGTGAGTGGASAGGTGVSVAVPGPLNGPDMPAIPEGDLRTEDDLRRQALFQNIVDGSADGSASTCSSRRSSISSAAGCGLDEYGDGFHVDGDLVELFVPVERRESLRREASFMQNLFVRRVDVQWIQVLAEGWCSPLRGFMRSHEYLQSLNFNCYQSQDDGYRQQGQLINHSVPITMSVSTADKERLQNERAIALRKDDQLLAVLRDPEFYPHEKLERAARTWASTDPKHPGVAMIFASGDWLIGGDLEVLDRIRWNDGLDGYRKTPRELRAALRSKHADVVYALQIRTPMHNGHMLIANETCAALRSRGFETPVLLLHPVGRTLGVLEETPEEGLLDEEVPVSVRMRQHEALIADGAASGLPDTVLALCPSPRLYTGPREVQWHAKMAMVVGADFYIAADRNASSDRLLLSMAVGLEHLHLLPFSETAYDRAARRMAFIDHQRQDDFVRLTWRSIRDRAERGLEPPPEFMAASGWRVLHDFYQLDLLTRGPLASAADDDSSMLGGDTAERNHSRQSYILQQEQPLGPDSAQDANPVALHSDFFLHRSGAAMRIDRRSGNAGSGGGGAGSGSGIAGGPGHGIGASGQFNGKLGWLRCLPATAQLGTMAWSDSDGEVTDDEGEGDEGTTWSLFI